MNLEITDFGPVHKASIRIDGLSVIAGENDTGKSTIGKSIFTLIKGVHNATELNEELRDKDINKLVEDIYFSARKFLGMKLFTELRDIFFPPRFFEDVKNKGSSAIVERENALLSYTVVGIENRGSSYLGDLFAKMKRLRALVDAEVDIASTQKKVITNIIFSEFKTEIVNRYSKSSVSNLKLVDNDIQILNCNFIDGKLEDYNLTDLVQYNDVTYVDSPAVVNFISQIDISRTFESELHRNDRLLTIPLHYKDLLAKLKNSRYFNVDEPQEIEATLCDIYNGRFAYDEKKNDFVYLKKNSFSVSSINTAAGIKSLGILYQLVSSGMVTEKTILILDEPEVNLHPKWQLEYAKVIVELITNGANILVNTHSPYMVEALKTFSVRRGVSSNFYLSHKIDGKATLIKDMCGDISEIVACLAKPFDDLHDLGISNDELYDL